MFRLRLLDCSKLTINRKNDTEVTICRHDVIVKFFWRCFVSLVNFSYWSKFIRDLPEIWKPGNTPVWVLLNIWRLGQVRDTNFGRDVSNEILVNAAKCQRLQGYSFYHFWVIKGKPTEWGGGGIIEVWQSSKYTTSTVLKHGKKLIIIRLQTE